MSQDLKQSLLQIEKKIDQAVPSLVLDTNMLIVFIIGSIDPNLLGKAKRVKEYNYDDYELIFTYVNFFSDVVLLPNIVSETSNILCQMNGERRNICLSRLANFVCSSNETYIESSFVVNQKEYIELGATDTSILCALDSNTYLLTADLSLYLAALCRKQNAQQFQDLRG